MNNETKQLKLYWCELFGSRYDGHYDFVAAFTRGQARGHFVSEHDLEWTDRISVKIIGLASRAGVTQRGIATYSINRTRLIKETERGFKILGTIDDWRAVIND